MWHSIAQYRILLQLAFIVTLASFVYFLFSAHKERQKSFFYGTTFNASCQGGRGKDIAVSGNKATDHTLALNMEDLIFLNTFIMKTAKDVCEFYYKVKSDRLYKCDCAPFYKPVSELSKKKAKNKMKRKLIFCRLLLRSPFAAQLNFSFL